MANKDRIRQSRALDVSLEGLMDEMTGQAPTNEAAMVIKSGGAVAITDKLEVSSVGVAIHNLSEEEWKAFFQFIQRVKTALQWIVGDWCAYGEERLRMTYEEMAAITGYKARSLRNYAYVARNVQMSTRVDKLSFKHHLMVAKLPDPAQKEWLQYALKNRMSYRELENAIAGSPALPTVDPMGAQNFKRNARFLGDLVDRVGEVGSVHKKDAEKALLRIEAMERWLEAARRMIEESLSDE